MPSYESVTKCVPKDVNVFCSLRVVVEGREGSRPQMVEKGECVDDTLIDGTYYASLGKVAEGRRALVRNNGSQYMR